MSKKRENIDTLNEHVDPIDTSRGVFKTPPTFINNPGHLINDVQGIYSLGRLSLIVLPELV